MDINHLELDVACYAQAAYHEGSNKAERIGVINVIRNRVRNGNWGRDVCSVVYSNGQFIGVTDDSHEPVDKKTYLEIQLLVLDTVVFNKYVNPVADALYFHDTSMQAKSQWFGKKKMVKIGRMVFY